MRRLVCLALGAALLVAACAGPKPVRRDAHVRLQGLDGTAETR